VLFLQQIGHHGSIQQCGAASFSSTEKLLQQRQRMRVASGRRMRPCNGGCPVHARRRRASSKESCTRSGRRDATRYPPHRAGTLRLLALALSAATARAACKAVTLDFLLLDGNSVHAAIEDDIRADLAVIGIDVVSRAVDRETFNADMVAGNYDMVFSETWGAPYDPHSFVASWTTPDEAHYSALPTAGIDTTQFAADVADILSESDAEARQAKWTTLLSSIHDEVIHLPLFGRRIPSVTTRSRLAGYAPGYQQFDYPIHKATVVSGSKTVTVAPGAQAGLFTSVGRLDPHSYRPNEFFANNWVYEGLVAYGADGAIVPSLATEWTETNSADGDTYRFTLRTGVTFHDGAAFNCAAVKLNFDHVWAGDLTSPDWHGWYSLPGALSEWSCDGEVFVLSTNAPYYPLLQELSYIRPLRMLSPNAFVGGAASDPYTQNSCPTGWGTVAATADHAEVTCAGTTAIAGTGPFMFESRTANADNADHDDLVVFAANTAYWGGAPDIEELRVVRYDSAADVEAALLDGSLDAVLGANVLEPATVRNLQYDTRFEVLHGEETQTDAIILNIADKEVRKAVVHAVNKVPICVEINQ
jgi:ABC-type transport system substrate-binding protein